MTTAQPPPTGGRSRHRDRIALATWPTAPSARIGARFRLDADGMAVAHPGIAPVAVLGWAVAQALRDHPDVNRRVVLFAVRPNPTVRVSFAVDLGHDLQVALVDRADELDARTLQRRLVQGSRAARAGRGAFTKATATMARLPVVLSRPGLRAWSLLTAGLGVPLLGFRAAPFGAALVSSVAAFELLAVDPPFVPFTRCALVLSIGAAHPVVVVRAGAVTPANAIDVSVTADHRVCDGSHFAAFAATVIAGCGGALPVD